jgi:deazaflavin-dependent oxidoreductase (nitroreductase family)
VPNDLTLKTMNALHRAVMTITFGRVGWRAGPMPVVELTTTGRKSGRPRTVLLTSPVQEDDAWVLVASRGGDNHHPAWFLNLQADPNVEARRAGEPKEHMRARVATPEERARLWPKVTATYTGYGNYQRKTEREIPLVLLEPAK